jgi:ATP-binding cassette subfamily C protein CydCD
MRPAGPLGALPRLSRAARRALAGCAVLAGFSGVALVAQAWALAEVITGSDGLAVLVGAVVARALLVWVTQVVAARAAAGAKEELRARLLDRALALGPEWTVPRGPALTVLATQGLDALDEYFTVYLPALVNAAVLPLGIGAVLLVADWPSALVVGLTLPLVPLFAALVGLRTKDRVAAASATEQRVAHHLRELVRARPVLTAFRRVDAQAATIRRISEAQRRSTMETLRVAFASALVLELVATLSVALVAVLIGLRLISGDLSLAVGLFVLVLAPECYLPLRQAGAAHHASEAGMQAVREIAELPPPPVFGDVAPVGELRVTDLRVRRRDGCAPDGVTFTARPGEVVHLSTPSGSGKSTTFAAILGFVTPTSGSIRIGAHDLSEVDIEAWRRRIAWVPQTPRFAGGIVRDEVGELAEQLNLTHVLDRPIAELSTGERQRVAVARALRRHADVLLLDEPTAHQDPANAARIQSAIAASGAAVVIASHRAAESTAAPVSVQATNTTNPEAYQRVPLRTLITPRLLAGAALGAAALLAGVALTATSAWLIAKAATQPPILLLGVAVVGVRAFGLARAGLRYAERLVTHDAAFRSATTRRVRLWRTADYRRLTTDVDTVRDLTPRVLLPPLVAAVVCVAAVIVQSAILPAAGLALTIAVAAAGLGAPAVALAVDRHATRALADGRRRVADRVLALLDAAPDLIAFGTHVQHRAEVAREDAALARRARRQALSAGAATALITLCLGLASATALSLAKDVDPLLVPVLALVPLALAETLIPLPTAVRQAAPLSAALAERGPRPPDFQPNEEHRQNRPEKALDPQPRPTNPSESPVRTAGDPPISTLPAAAAIPEASATPSPYESPIGTAGGPPISTLPAAAAFPEASATPSPYESPVRTAGGPPDFQPSGEDRQNRGVALRGVDIRWPGAAAPTLRNVSLDIPPGTHLAVTGPSGAGKSTLLALMAGLLPAERGTVSLPRTAWVPQEPHLVATTLRENLRIADPHATDDQLRAALRQAEIPAWADRLDDDPTTASGGEAQRIALARALLADADLLLLDEPTAHLDEPTAARVLANLEGRTIVHVTHRPEEAAAADAILDLTSPAGRLEDAHRPEGAHHPEDTHCPEGRLQGEARLA